MIDFHVLITNKGGGSAKKCRCPNLLCPKVPKVPKYCPAYLATSVQKVGIGNLHKDSRGDMKIWWVGVKSSCHYSKSLI